MAYEVEDSQSIRSISVVIVSWNCREALLECLRSLRAHPPSVPYDCIVIDNNSTDGTVKAVQTDAPWVQLVANPTNRGLARANNQGLLASTAKAVVISNPDVEFGPGSIDALLEVLDRRPKAAFVIARLVNPDGSLQASAGDLPTVGEALLGRDWQRKRARQPSEGGFWWDGWAADSERQIGHGVEACYAVRRDAIAQIGLQDERFPLDWEGIDWSERAHREGWEVWFCPAAEIVHKGGVSIRQVPFRWTVLSHLGIYRYFAKRSPAWARPLLAAAFTVRAAAKVAALRSGMTDYERVRDGRRADA